MWAGRVLVRGSSGSGGGGLTWTRTSSSMSHTLREAAKCSSKGESQHGGRR